MCCAQHLHSATQQQCLQVTWQAVASADTAGHNVVVLCVFLKADLGQQSLTTAVVISQSSALWFVATCRWFVSKAGHVTCQASRAVLCCAEIMGPSSFSSKQLQHQDQEHGLGLLLGAVPVTALV